MTTHRLEGILAKMVIYLRFALKFSIDLRKNFRVPAGFEFGFFRVSGFFGFRVFRVFIFTQFSGFGLFGFHKNPTRRVGYPTFQKPDPALLVIQLHETPYGIQIQKFPKVK